MAGSALERIEQDPESKALYAALLEELDGLGPYEVEVHKASLHLTHGRAFLGVHPRRSGLLLDLVTEAPLAGDRVVRTEQLSARRCHSEVLVHTADELDAELRAWLEQAYALTN